MRFIVHLVATILMVLATPAIAGTVVSSVPVKPDPGARRCEIAGAGHAMPRSHPAELAEALAAHLARN
ncbi:MAG: hypothetical protein QF578_19865 [Alphaproteobacteria bacterium]|jgi:pimeloyl-ACP methyl ester carboxylesterase|nr:hypothetical protein [Alphaproteobacteria bacterium]MDP6567095.1 hypothetical protein [Alphaproteobacteria bacterium]MDP6813157.1 hypothetical protein [Alphaproteobacteria bacterium]